MRNGTVGIKDFKKKPEFTFWQNVLGWTVVSLVVGGIIAIIFFGFFVPQYKETKLCADSLGIKYSFWTGGGNDIPNYNYVNDSLYNCCIYNPHLNKEGFYDVEVCKGFQRNMK